MDVLIQPRMMIPPSDISLRSSYDYASDIPLNPIHMKNSETYLAATVVPGKIKA